MRRSSILLAATVITMLLIAPVHAASGRLDRSFSGNGKQTQFPKGAAGYAVAIDKRGRILVAGYTLTAKTDLALARFLPNGKPDPSFGKGDGRVTTNLGATDYGFDMALQADGKIVVAGERAFNDHSQFAVARYGIRGILDKSFSKDGMNFTEFHEKYQGANAVAISPNGDITLGGYTANGTSSRWALARYRPNGSLDPRFGNDGRVTTDVSSTFDQIEDITLLPSGGVVVGGYAEVSRTPRYAIGQYGSGGKLVPSFGHKGVTTVDVTKGGDTGYGLARQGDGKLILVGSVSRSGRNDWGIVRFGPKGRLDKTFGTLTSPVVHLIAPTTIFWKVGFVQMSSRCPMAV